MVEMHIDIAQTANLTQLNNHLIIIHNDCRYTCGLCRFSGISS